MWKKRHSERTYAELAHAEPRKRPIISNLLSFDKKPCNDLPIVMKPYRMVVHIFLPKLQFNGLYGSAGPSKWTICSLSVFKCSSRWVWGIARSGCLPRILDSKDRRCPSSAPELGALDFSLISKFLEVISLSCTLLSLTTRVRRKVNEVYSARDACNDFLGFCLCIFVEHGVEASRRVQDVLLSHIWSHRSA